MAYKVNDIVYEDGNYWVAKDKKESAYIVYKAGITHSVSDSAYPLTEDGKTLAIARAHYLASR